jgi:hypothetical protein
MIRIIGIFFIAITLSACGFQHRRYTSGYYGAGFETPVYIHPAKNKLPAHPILNQALLDSADCIAILPNVTDTIIDSVRTEKELLNDWEGDRLIKENNPTDSISEHPPILDKKIEMQAQTSLVSGHLALWAPLAGVVIPYVLNAAFPNNGSLALLFFSLYAMLQFVGFLAILVGAVNGFKVTKTLESNGLSYLFNDVYETARKGKRLVMIAMAIRLGLIFLSTLGFLILISYFVN